MKANAALAPTAQVEENQAFKATENVIPRKSATAIQRWIRLDDDRSFGSVTGSEFRVWGDDK
jgi:hypothetical protein